MFRFPLISIESSACNMSDYVLERLGGEEEEEIVSPASRARLAAPDYICSSHPEHLNLWNFIEKTDNDVWSSQHPSIFPGIIRSVWSCNLFGRINLWRRIGCHFFCARMLDIWNSDVDAYSYTRRKFSVVFNRWTLVQSPIRQVLSFRRNPRWKEMTSRNSTRHRSPSSSSYATCEFFLQTCFPFYFHIVASLLNLFPK